MQWIDIERDKILKPLQIVTGIVERRQALPILSHVLLEKNASSVKMVSTDLEMQIATIANIGFGQESSRTTVQAKKLQDILHALPKSNVKINTHDGHLIIQAGYSRFSLLTLQAEDFPEFPTDKPFQIKFTVTQNALKYLLNSTHFSMAQNDVRHCLNGLLLSIENNRLTAIATDGHRLAKATIPLTTEISRFPLTEIIVPRKSILEIQKIISQTNQLITISISEKNIKFELDQITIISKLVDGRYPDYKRVLGSNYNNNCLISREKFQQGLQKAALLVSEKYKSVSLTFDNNRLYLNVQTPQNEILHDEIECTCEASAVKITFNVQYLLDLCNHLKSQLFNINFSNSDSKIQINIHENETNPLDFSYVVMPMRI